MNKCNFFRINNDCALNCLLYLNNYYFQSNWNLAHFLSQHPLLESKGIQYDQLEYSADQLGIEISDIEITSTSFHNKKISI